MEEITLNLIPGGATQIVHASQFDKGRQFKLITYEGDEPFNPSTYTAEFEAIKPDRNIVQANVAKDSTSVTVTTTEQMCAVEGDTICEIRFSKSGSVIGTANFILRVELDPIFAGTNSASEGPVADTLTWLRNNKENVLIAGDNIQISRTGGNAPRTTISATDTTYTAGDHISISGTDNEISATYSAGNGITINGDVIADVPYTAGQGIAISAGREISTNVATLPIASTSTLGCIKVGPNFGIESDGTLTAHIASTATLGLIKVGANLGIDPDGTLSATGGSGGGDYLAGENIQISAARVISATDTTYSDATTSTAGLMSVADKIKLNGIEDNANNYSLPIASTSSLGGIKVGFYLDISQDGTLSVSSSGYEQTISIPSTAWNSSTHKATLSVSGVTATTHQEILPMVVVNNTDVVNNLKLQTANIMDAGQSAGSITLYAANVPSETLNIRVLIRP